ncbi:FAD-dependent oxidoreductase [Cohnella luojiensis]|uniref:FAD-dependent oxidoreductase n=1 Tax=Cohnella luojiensis TaxID=652876 RepID=UPI0014306ADB|nr:FAD-dependent oxidoreductase [Cohnella luojiensis]
MILVGGGHAHLYVLKQLQLGGWPDTRVTLISLDRYQYYSSMFSSYVEGRYGLEDIRIDLPRLCDAVKIDFLNDSVETVDPERQEIVTSNGVRMNYDLISFNIGSRIANTSISGVEEYAALIKPNYLISALKNSSLKKERLVVVGGGASGIEMSLSLQTNRKGLGLKDPVTLISKGPLLEHAGRRVTRQITGIVQNKGIHLIQNDPVISVHRNRVDLQSGHTVAYDELLWLTGPAAPSIFRKSRLSTDAQGYLLVNDNLQSVVYENMFGVGDCVSLQTYPFLHKAGVYAVREAPILWSNMERFLSGGKLNKYRPQSKYLSILSTGEGEALLLYRGISIHGKWCWRLKQYIDSSFIRKYQ